jgi:hypothetical protein
VPGLEATVSFAGDVFEMEDQRNWSDASYKTYCTPLGLPFPVEVQAGDEVHQRVTLRVSGAGACGILHGDVPIQLRLGGAVTLPRIGFGCSPAVSGQVAALRALRPEHLRVDLKLGKADQDEVLQRAAVEATALGTALKVALHVPSDGIAEVERCIRRMTSASVPVAAWLLYDSDAPTTRLDTYNRIRPLLKEYEPQALVAAGSNANFAELNRNRLPAGSVEMLCFAMNPQVHACDERSIVETLESVPDLLRGARRIAGNVPIAVSPVTLKPRFNAVATEQETPPAPGEVPSHADPRQGTLFAAAWTLGHLAELAAAGAHSATYYETTGCCGLLEEGGTGGLFPLYHVFADVASFASYPCHALDFDASREVCGLCFQSELWGALLCANLTATAKELDLSGLSGVKRYRLLEARDCAAAAQEPEAWRRTREACKQDTLVLPPWGYLRLEWLREH